MMYFPAIQMSTNDPMFWIMLVIALSFIVIAIAMVAIALFRQSRREIGEPS